MKINSKEIKQVSYNVARKRKKEITNNKEKGITLIALVVTIVVLLILAGVTITMVLGEDGIIQQAKLAAERVKEEEAKAQEDLNKLAGDIQNWVNGGIGETESGDVTPPANPTPTPEQSTPFEKTTEVTVGKDTMTVPGGFRVKEGDSIAEGIVITDSAGDTGNEFVWVPVAINDMVWCKDHAGSTITFDKKTNTFTCTHDEGATHEPTTEELAGKLYNFSGNTLTPITTYNANSGFREPAIVTGDSSGNGASYDGADENLSKVVEGAEKTKEEFLKQLQNEFYNMAKSVAKYGGFYIGRYETSGLKDGETPAVKPGEPTVETDWYTMYKNSKEIAKGTGATSSMIWGCQWDAVMKWMKDVENTTKEGKYYITDSTGMGRYDQSKKTTTGSNTDYAVKNIYDMAGNVIEWTMEAHNTNYRVPRGGSCYDSGSSNPASSRSGPYPIDSSRYDSLSSRATLYVN